MPEAMVRVQAEQSKCASGLSGTACGAIHLADTKIRKGCAIFVIRQFVKSGLSADDSRIAMLNSAFGAW